ncbi:YhbD family protein [Brevibacillus ruminantium]|uniref:YhbD family protein n=1 Tax=Brevibacillus ruminantium TaxID=2950604 RepID=A0ABY4WK24_9BACL|nr:YhbD family protein [Brevibacillus ruminantium]USG67467.1 YhbD family protein [Brevibacillus ruminantium]
MEPGLISKKELLELTGISYGQLYRWKRKQLIPEEWFIRKSTFTGQETFFPKDKILIRIDKILHMKDDLSLDELADMFSPHAAELTLSKDELVRRNIVSSVSLDFYLEQTGDSEAFTFERLLHLFVLDKMLKTGEINLDEGKMLIQIFQDHAEALEGKNFDLLFVRKMGISTFLLIESDCQVFVENSARIVRRLQITGCIEELKRQIV